MKRIKINIIDAIVNFINKCTEKEINKFVICYCILMIAGCFSAAGIALAIKNGKPIPRLYVWTSISLAVTFASIKSIFSLVKKYN